MIGLLQQWMRWKMIIGTFAYCGSGQDTLADGICKYYNYVKMSLGDVIRKYARKIGLFPSRENLQAIRRDWDSKYGRCYLPNQMLQYIRESGYDNIILTGLRTMEEYEILQEQLGMVLVFVYADEGIRYQRMLKRNSEKDAKSIHALKEQMRVEEELFDYPELEAHADIKYVFNMNINTYIANEKEVVDSVLRDIEACQKRANTSKNNEESD